MNKIEVQNLTVSYGERNKRFTALDKVSFSVAAGQFVTIIGSSGCGKSTLLATLGGLILPKAGIVEIDGIPVTGTGTNRAFVFQHYSLFPWMTVRKNVAFGIKQAMPGLKPGERLKRAAVFLEKVGLEHFTDAWPARLSGGMRQRAAIARALAMDTEILLMDEPFGAVDAKNRAILQDLLLRLWEGDETDTGMVVPLESPLHKERKTVVLVTHDIDEAILLSDRIIMLTNSPGRIFKEFTVSIPRPRCRAALVLTHAYQELRSELLALFFNDYGEGI
ncbi:MAG: ABC transporter ATP-binding protein [Treponema sp.]|jgi:NitT/TauT family transport system ATP-binding protein|nr:ABC transporter ATP-binding protein [Treponema sp.]